MVIPFQLFTPKDKIIIRILILPMRRYRVTLLCGREMHNGIPILLTGELPNHSADANDNNTMVPVVRHHDLGSKDTHGNNSPALELQSRFSDLLPMRYKHLMETTQFIACQKLKHNLGDLALTKQKPRLLAEGLMIRSETIFSL